MQEQDVVNACRRHNGLAMRPYSTTYLSYSRQAQTETQRRFVIGTNLSHFPHHVPGPEIRHDAFFRLLGRNYGQVTPMVAAKAHAKRDSEREKGFFQDTLTDKITNPSSIPLGIQQL